MREGSYMEIEPGMQVVGPTGEEVGTVSEVVVDDASGIFHGLAIRSDLFDDVCLAPGEQVESVLDGVVTIASRVEGLEPYVPVEQRMAATQTEYA